MSLGVSLVLHTQVQLKQSRTDAWPTQSCHFLCDGSRPIRSKSVAVTVRAAARTRPTSRVPTSLPEKSHKQRTLQPEDSAPLAQPFV